MVTIDNMHQGYIFKPDVFRVWPFTLLVACACCFLHWTWTIAVPSWSLESIQGLLHTSTQLTPTARLHILLLVVQCYRFCWCCLFCLLALLHIPSWGWRGRRGSMCMLYFVAAVALCVRVRGAGANLNTVKRIVTLDWNQTNLIYNNLSEKSKYSNEPKNTLYFLFWLTAQAWCTCW